MRHCLNPLIWLTLTGLAACSSQGDIAVGGGQSSNAGATDFAIAYIKRTLPTDPVALANLRALDDLQQQRDYWGKADVYLRDKASPSGVERNITARVTGTNVWDARDLDVSPDGRKLLFAMRGPIRANQPEEDAPTWNIWEYSVETDVLRRIIADDVTAEAGQDVSPHYLADGNILFSSTRQREAKAILIDEGKSGFEAENEDLGVQEPAFVLHVMDPMGTLGSIRQISYGQSHDLNPSLLSSGRILFSRWDNTTGNPNDGMHLYSARPDGADLQLLYGARSHNSGTVVVGVPSVVQFAKAREMQDGRVLAQVRPFANLDFGGNLIVIDAPNFVENAQRTLAGANITGSGQAVATTQDVRTVTGPSPGGRFNSGWPLWDGTGRILVSWSQCRLLDATLAIVPCTEARLADPAAQVAPPLYSAWLVNPTNNTLAPVVTATEGDMLTEVVSLQARTVLPQFLPNTPNATELAPDLAVGVLDIRSVYEFDSGLWPGLGTATIDQVAARPAALRPARFIRLEKAVSIPSDDVLDFDQNIAFGRAGNFMREILGYTPVEADGSVRVRVPANVAFNVVVVDAAGRRLFANNRVWQQFRPGETGSCNGCYYAPTGAAATALSHGRRGLFTSAYGGAPTGATCANGVRETMAQVRTGWSCGANPFNAPAPGMNVFWDGTPTAETTISFRYQDLSTLQPTRSVCTTSWNSSCRSTISYPLHIRPLWLLPRLDGADADTAPDTCIDCHNAAPRDASNVIKPPGGQLNLTDDAAQATLALQAERAYDELTLGHGFVIEIPDPNNPGQFILVASPVQRPAVIAAGNARASVARFFSTFESGSHAGRLTEAELRLLSEWVDIGTQFYNNPFDAPLN